MQRKHFVKIKEKYGHLTIITEPYVITINDKRRPSKYNVVDCRCDCGNIKYKVRPLDLVTKRIGEYCSKSCVIRQNSFKEKQFVPEQKQTVKYNDDFDRWKVISEPYYKWTKHPKIKNFRIQYVLCRCQCGTEKEVACYQLMDKRSKSCGCITTSGHRKKKSSLVQKGLKKCCNCSKIIEESNFTTNNESIDKYAYRCKNCDRDIYLKRNYQISLVEFNRLLENQNYSCACCGSQNPFSLSGNNFVVDHCHKTSKIRGLLCNKCNQGLGLFGDNLDGITKAYEYLKQFEEINDFRRNEG